MCVLTPSSALRWLFAGTLLSFVAGCGDPIEPLWRVPFELQSLSQDTQSATVGSALTRELEVQVLNRRGRPIAGVDVEFAARAGGGSFAPASIRTDAAGTARTVWTLGTAAGLQAAEARVAGTDLSPVEFAAHASPASPSVLIKVSGDGQRGLVERPLAEPLVVQATDAYGNPVPGAPVFWTTRGIGSGHVTPDADTTDASGLVRATWVPGLHPQTGIRAIAGIESDSAVFTAAAEGVVARVKLLVHFSDSASFRTVLQPTIFPVRALAYGEGDAWVGEIGFSWTTSDTAIAVVRSDPDDSAQATVVVRGEGDFRVSTTAQGVVASIEVRAVSVAPGFTAEFTGLSGARALNDAGEVVGWKGQVLTAWQGGQTVDLGFALQGHSNSVTAMNDRRSILVFSILTSNTGLIYGVGTSRLIRGGHAETVTGQYALALDIDANDRVVGALQSIPPSHRPAFNTGFLWENGQITRLEHASEPTSAYAQSRAVAINDNGVVVVNMTRHIADPTGFRAVSGAAYLWEAGQYTPIPSPASSCVHWAGTAIDRAGRVLVNCIAGEDSPAAFLWDGASYIPLAPLHAASDLNDRGEIVGRRGEEIHLWRNGAAIRLLDPAVPSPGALRINNRGQILMGAYLLTPDR